MLGASSRAGRVPLVGDVLDVLDVPDEVVLVGLDDVVADVLDDVLDVLDDVVADVLDVGDDVDGVVVAVV